MSEGFESRLVTGTRDTELEREWIISGEQWKVDGDKRFGNTTLQDDIRQVGDLFRRSDCVLHAVDIGGLRLDPENTTVDNPAENSLFELAQPTGGEVLRSSNDFRGAARPARREHEPRVRAVLPADAQRAGGEVSRAPGEGEGRRARASSRGPATTSGRHSGCSRRSSGICRRRRDRQRDSGLRHPGADAASRRNPMPPAWRAYRS